VRVPILHATIKQRTGNSRLHLLLSRIGLQHDDTMYPLSNRYS